MNNIAIKDIRATTICEEIEKGWPGIYGATWSGYGSIVDIWQVGKQGRNVQLVFGVLAIGIESNLYDLEFNTSQPFGLTEFRDEVMKYLNRGKPYLYSDSECQIGPMTYHSTRIDRMKQNPSTVNARFVVNGFTSIPFTDFEDLTDLIKTVLNIFHLIEHPSGFDSWENLKDSVLSTNWDRDQEGFGDD